MLGRPRNDSYIVHTILENGAGSQRMRAARRVAADREHVQAEVIGDSSYVGRPFDESTLWQRTASPVSRPAKHDQSHTLLNRVSVVERTGGHADGRAREQHHGRSVGESVLANFQLTILIGYIVGWILTIVFIGVLVVLAASVLSIIFGIMAALAANEGRPYKYPIAIPFVK